MTKATPKGGKVMLFPDSSVRSKRRVKRDRLEKARYVAQMSLELERLAATANLELVAYFLAMARAEAEAVAGGLDQV